MFNLTRRRTLPVVCLLAAFARHANAFQTGITGLTTDSVTGCNQCHNGGATPTVTLTEPPTPTPTTTFTKAATPTPTGTMTATPVLTPTPTPNSCVGDCGGSSQVTIGDIITMVNIALENAPVSACAAGDRNQDGEITVDEILAAVSNALDGCAMMAIR